MYYFLSEQQNLKENLKTPKLMDTMEQSLRSTVASISRDRMWAYAQTFQNQSEPEDLKLLVKFSEIKEASEILADVEEKRKTLKQIKQ